MSDKKTITIEFDLTTFVLRSNTQISLGEMYGVAEMIKKDCDRQYDKGQQNYHIDTSNHIMD